MKCHIINPGKNIDAGGEMVFSSTQRGSFAPGDTLLSLETILFLSLGVGAVVLACSGQRPVQYFHSKELCGFEYQ